MIEVVNKKTHTPSPNDIYIGRGSALGNPYTSMNLANTKAEFQCESREESIALYKAWLTKKLADKDPVVRKAMNEIYSKALTQPVNLVCFCKPLSCHGDVILELVQEALDKR
jgi:hypothetical protein